MQTKREVQVLQTLQRHPFIVQYIDSFHDPSTLYIVMEYCAGGTLHERILQKRDKGVQLPALSFVAQIALAVQVVVRARSHVLYHRMMLTAVALSGVALLNFDGAAPGGVHSPRPESPKHLP
eukprot:SAG11_NODE_2016_length_3919_cov_4.215445_2_plen_122_part_00